MNHISSAKSICLQDACSCPPCRCAVSAVNLSSLRKLLLLCAGDAYYGHAELRNQILQFGVKLPKKESFLGMPKSKNWILYGQQLDPFGLHNWLGFNLARATNEYAPRTQFCEVRVSAPPLILFCADTNEYQLSCVGLVWPEAQHAGPESG